MRGSRHSVETVSRQCRHTETETDTETRLDCTKTEKETFTESVGFEERRMNRWQPCENKPKVIFDPDHSISVNPW